MSRPLDGRAADRAQSEVTGSTLLVGLIVVVVTVTGSLLLTQYLDAATRGGPPVDLDANVTDTEVRLTHAGGEVLATGDVTVVLRTDGGESRSKLSTWTLERDDGDADFEPAERARTAHGLGPGQVEVVVVHWPTESVLLDETFEIEGP